VFHRKKSLKKEVISGTINVIGFGVTFIFWLPFLKWGKGG